MNIKNEMMGLGEKLKAGEWKKLPKWFYAAAGGVLLLLGVLLICCSGSVSSDEDFMALYDERSAELKDDYKESWSRMKWERSGVLRALRGEKGGDMGDALTFAIRHAPKSAFVYLVEEKGAKISDEYEVRSMMTDAATAGRLDIIKYLVEDQGLNVSKSALGGACSAGELEVCKYLVEEQGIGLSGDNGVACLLIFCMSESKYAECAKNMTRMFGRKVTAEELKARYLELAEYLIEQGADASDKRLQAMLDKTDHTELVALIRKAAK